MSKFSRRQVAGVMESTGLVSLFYHPDVTVGKEVLHAVYDGGARVLEFTNRGDFAHEVFAELNKYVRKELPDLIMGVGSVIDAGTASLYLQLGANFIVSPMLVEEIAWVCNRRKVLWSPGCGSLSEINRAHELGVEIVKLFPGSVYSPGFVRAVKGPCPWVSIMPTGGVSPTEESLEKWFGAGVSCVGMGSKLMVRNNKGTYNYNGIRLLTEQALEIIGRIRSDKK